MKRHPASLPLDQLREQCDTRFQRRSGPGGQHRNKVETMVSLTHRPTGIEASASERRQQAQNLTVAFQRLRVRLAVEVRTAWSKQSTTWTQRCKGGRIVVSIRHDDFALCLAEALDALEAHDWQHQATAEALSCSATQLLRLLKLEPTAFQKLNRHRENRGQFPLK